MDDDETHLHVAYASHWDMDDAFCSRMRDEGEAHLHRPFDNPHDAVREIGTYGGRRQSRWPRTADGFAVCAGDQYKIIKIKFVASMIAVTPATASSKASLASW